MMAFRLYFEMVELPPKYYHTNFEYLLDFVKDKYKSLLIEQEWRFLRKYYSLPEDAQCLFIRFTNRKGLFFKTEGLKYEELEEIQKQLQVLEKQGFVSRLNFEEHRLWLTEILAVLTKTDLLSLFDLKTLKNEKREVLVDFVKNEKSVEEIFETINSNIRLVKVNFEQEVSFLRFLFFGNKSMDMTEFVLRDMGLVQYYQHSDDDLVARFETRKDAEDKWMVSEQFVVFDSLKSESSDSEILDWYSNLYQTCLGLSAIALPSFQKLQLRIGRYFEQRKNYQAAIEVFDQTQIVPSRERKARCLVKLGYIEEAKATCHEMMEFPLNVDEEYFAEYFLKTIEGKKNKKQTTDWLKTADEITIDRIYRNQVEFGSIEYYLELGFSAGFSENHTWRTLFGLLFWEIIFDPSLVSFHHPFQRRPSDLHLPEFYEKRKSQIHNLLDGFVDKDEFLVYLWENYQKNEGVANPFVVWVEEIWEMVRVMVLHLELEQLKKVMLKIAENLVENSRGLPDLLVWSENHYEFVEIKSPNDTLSNQQLFWLKYFKELGVNAKVLRVKFE
jgi:hypothetical protein